MYAVSLGRYILGRRCRRNRPSSSETRWWGRAFAIGSGMAGLGWGAAGVLLYPEAELTHQVYLIFVLGGMMLGAASLLAPLREAFLSFLIPSGFVPALRLVLAGSETHLAMGLLAGLFTGATLVTTNRIHLTIASSLRLRFENQDLLENLQRAKSEAEALNEQLETRVQARTAELHHAAEQLRAEITQREQVEEELLRARKLESLGVLAGGIAHDFNNFLTVVQGNVEIAGMQLSAEDPVRTILEDTQLACRHAAFLASQLLTFAKGGAPVRRVASVARLVIEAVQLARAGAPISIDLAIQEDLWCASLDPGQIGQVLHNILLNARQAMPDGGIVEVRAQNVAAEALPGTGDRVRITIRDYGCGIPADVLPRIFDPYFTTKPGGKGLGLATAYAIVTRHAGSLSVESKPGDGTLFTIDLPASQEQPDEPAQTASGVQTGTGRVLVMDDEEALRKLLVSVLTSIGYEVQAARDGAEAIALCEASKRSGRSFDLVLLDLTVSGGMGGVEAAAALKRLDPSLKLIVSSGYSDASVMSDFRRFGFDDVLPKPWTLGQLSEVFRRVSVPDPDRAS
jgi:signal transduction histidine kinase/ActR/RegA family two-component response regulator